MTATLPFNLLMSPLRDRSVFKCASVRPEAIVRLIGGSDQAADHA
jgi:hypothetical protein